MINKIINLARDIKKNGKDEFSGVVMCNIDNLPLHDRIKGIVEVIKQLKLDPDSYILFGKSNSYFPWITDDILKKIKERLRNS